LRSSFRDSYMRTSEPTQAGYERRLSTRCIYTTFPHKQSSQLHANGMNYDQDLQQGIFLQNQSRQIQTAVSRALQHVLSFTKSRDTYMHHLSCMSRGLLLSTNDLSHSETSHRRIRFFGRFPTFSVNPVAGLLFHLPSHDA
jgi:hypothetical protein